MKLRVLLLYTSFFYFSCQEKIEFPLKPAEPLLVVDAWFNTHAGRQQEVYLTLSESYYDEYVQVDVQGAQIVLKSNNQTFSFYEHFPGFYLSTENLSLQSGVDYELEIQWNGKTYRAISKAKDLKYPIDSIQLIPRIDTVPIIQEIDTVVSLWMHKKESETYGDYYLSKYYINQVLQTSNLRTYTIFGDFVSNGLYQSIPVHDIPLQSMFFADSVQLELYSIDRGFYEYIQAIFMQTDYKGSLFDVPSANAKGNFSGGALGYFLVSDVQKVSKQVN